MQIKGARPVTPGHFFALLALNAFAWVASSHAYTAWSIRTRNEAYYALLGRTVNLDRADRADEIAAGVVRWLRPLLLVAVNLAWVALVVSRPNGGVG